MKVRNKLKQTKLAQIKLQNIAKEIKGDLNKWRANYNAQITMY